MYNLITWKEGPYFIGKVLENSVSSFGSTEQEAYDNTLEALKLYNENNTQKENIQVSSPKLYSLDLAHA